MATSDPIQPVPRGLVKEIEPNFIEIRQWFEFLRDKVNVAASGEGTVDWDNIENKPLEFPPEDHNQDWSTIFNTPTSHYGYGILGPYNVLMQLYVPTSDPDVIGTKVNDYLAALREEGILTAANDIDDLDVPVSPPDVIAPKINEILVVLRDEEGYLVGDFLVDDLVVPESDPDVLGAKMNEIMKNMNTLNLIGSFEAISHNDIADNGVDNHLQYSRVDGARAFTAPVGGVDPTSVTHLTTRSWVEASLKAIETQIRITSGQTLNADYRNWFVNTDGGAVALALPAGDEDLYFRITNTGSSGLKATITPDGTEKLKGVNAAKTLSDGSTVILQYNSIDGWW